MRFELIRGGDASSARGMWYALYIPASHLPLGKKHALLSVDGLMTAKKKSQSLLKELTTSGISVSAANIVTLPLGKMQGGVFTVSLSAERAQCIARGEHAYHLAPLYSLMPPCHADVLKVRLQLQAASFSSRGKERSGGQARGLVSMTGNLPVSNAIPALP